jgi:diguanylate cyclase (GGDEF)-like protein/PAS domain S-box-containing protein
LDVLARFFDRSLDLHCVAEPDGTILQVNARWQDVLGWEPAALIGSNVLDLAHPDDIDRLTRSAGAARDLGSLVSFRIRSRTMHGDYRWLEWNTAHDPELGVHHGTARDVTSAVEQEAQLNCSNAILSIIAQEHASLLEHGADRHWWEGLLSEIIDVTGSEYGFIGFTDTDDEGPYLRSMAITDISWDEETRRFYELNSPAGIIFRNPNTLFGEVLVQRDVVIANDVARDARRGGTPPGHPPLQRFLGLPVGVGDEMVGMVGLANRAEPYDDRLLRQLEPLVAFLRSVVLNFRLSEQRLEAERAAGAAHHLQDRILEATESAIVAFGVDGVVHLANEHARRILPMLALRPADSVDACTPEPLRSWITSVIGRGAATGRSERFTLHDALGHELPVDARLVPLRDEGDTISGHVLTLTDMTVQMELERSAAENEVLLGRLDELARRQELDRGITETIDLVRASSSIEEALEVIFRAMQRFHPGAGVALYRPGADLEGHVLMATNGSAEVAIVDRDCWALRSRRPSGTWMGSAHTPCRHGAAHVESPRFCLPFEVLGSIEGLVVVELGQHVEEWAPTGPGTVFGQTSTMVERFIGALTNLRLRLQLEEAANSDPLTGLANRRSFRSEASRLIVRAMHAGTGAALAMIDVDGFKAVNDERGHEVGDRLLRGVADVLRTGLRPTDACGRVGGDEFAVLLTDLPADRARARLEELRLELTQRCRIDGVSITASIGFVHSSEVSGVIELDAMMAAADVALYAAKGAGRNRTCGSGDE